ncbi:hypothetical protein TNCV_218241 [Trichonephila clavipes]|nr:hypothetical protein TNCV_218241 [Trichonephila clavipes]
MDGEPVERVPLMARDTIFWARYRTERLTFCKSRWDMGYKYRSVRRTGLPTVGLNSRRAACSLVRFVEGEERWEAPDNPPGVSPSKSGRNRVKSRCRLYDAQGYRYRSRICSPLRDEFHGP